MKFGVSMITMNHMNFVEDLRIFNEIEKIEYLHIDVMDGKFVPRYGLYPEILIEASQHTNMPFDIHLMVENVEFAIDQFKEVDNVETISFHHFTNEGRVYKIIDKIKMAGAEPVLVIDLSTNLETVKSILESNELAGIMFMGIHPGVLKQEARFKISSSNIDKFNEFSKGLRVVDNFQIDGAFNFKTASGLKACGINNFVGGSSTFLNGVASNMDISTRRKQIFTNVEKIWRILSE